MYRFTPLFRLSIIFAIIFTFQAARGADMADNLLHYWSLGSDYNDTAKLYNPTATTVNATVGGTIGGITTGGPTGGYTAFSNGGQLSIGQPADMEFSRSNPAGMDFSFTWWGMMAASNTQYGTFISNKNWDSGANVGYIISNDSNKMWLNMATSRIDLRSGTVAKDQWYFYTTTTDDTAGVTFLYVGDMSGNLAISTVNTSGVSTLDGTLDWWLGNSVGDGKTNYKLTGGMADVGVWNTALREQEVRNIYRAGLAGESLSAIMDITPSAKSGTWGDTSSWDGGAAPVSARVMDGHAIVADANAAVSQLWLEDGGSLTVASGAKLAASNLLTMQNGAKLDIQGEMTVPDVWIQGGEIALSGKLTLAEPHIKNAPPRDIPLLSVSGQSAELSNQETVTVADVNFAAGAVLTKSGAGALSVGAFSGQNATLRVVEGITTVWEGTTNGNTFALAGGTMALRARGDKGLMEYYYTNQSSNVFDPLNRDTGLVDMAANGLLPNIFPAYTPIATPINSDFKKDTNPAMGEYFANIWTGFFTADQTGTYTIDGHSDDYGYFWIDLNLNNVFDAGEGLVGSYYNNDRTSTMSLEAGVTYPVAMVFTENIGGDYWRFRMKAPDGTSMVNILDNNEQGNSGGFNGGTWYQPKTTTQDYSDVAISAEGTGSVLDIAGEAHVGSLHLNAGSELALAGAGQLAVNHLSGSGAMQADGSATLVLGDRSMWAIDIWGTGPDEHDQIDMGNLSMDIADGLTLEIRNLSDEDIFPSMIFDVMVFDDLTAQLGLSDGDILPNITFVGDYMNFNDAYLMVSGNSLALGGMQSVPEPSTWLMLVLGVFGLGIWRTRKR